VLAAFAAARVTIEFVKNIYYNINMLNKSHLKTAWGINRWQALSQAHLPAESAVYGRERRSLGEQGGWARGTQDQGVNRGRLKA
jgi:hypothetical protein